MCPPIPRAVCIALLALTALLGCRAEPLPDPDASDFAFDGGSDRGLLAPDGAVADLALPFDRGADARRVDGAPVDAGTPEDAEPDAAPDAAPLGPPVDAPTHAQAAVVRSGDDTWFVWADAEGRVVRMRVDRSGRADPPEVVDTPSVKPDRVMALDVHGHPWVAYGSVGEPVVIFQVDLPEATRRVFETLRGPPTIAGAGEGLLVIAAAPEGNLRWLRIDHELVASPPVDDRFGFGQPDDAAEVAAGVVLVYDGPGQCVQIDDETWTASGNFICPTGQARLLSDGLRMLISRVYRFALDEAVGVRPLYARDQDYRIGYYEVSDGTRFQNEGPRRPLVVRRTYGGVRRLVATVVDPYATWETVETWADTAEWPFDRVRAMTRRALPGRARQGVCPDGGACFESEACGGEPCEGGVGAEHLVALDFRSDGRPQVRLYAMARRGVGQPAYSIPDPDGCVPRAEQCDLIDQDCDRLLDDGQCCESTADLSFRWATLRPVAHRIVDGRLSYEMLMADVQSNNAYRLLYRFDGTDEWSGRTLHLRGDPSGVPGNLGVRFEGARQGRFFLAAGGISALIARQVDDEGQLGGWAVFMAHPSRDEPGEDAPRPVVPLDCDEVLAADTLSHTSPAIGGGDGEQLLVVCPDKMIRIFAVREGLDQIHRFDGFQVPEVAWATIARVDEAELQVIVGFPVPGEGLWSVRVFDFDGAVADGPERGLVPSQLNAMGPADAVSPIFRHPVLGRPPIQIRSGPRARMAFDGQDADGRDATVWRDVILGPTPDRIVFSPTHYRIFASAPVPPEEGQTEATGWWAVNVRGDDDIYGLWSTRAAFEHQGPVAMWYATGGSYGVDDPLVDIRRYDLGFVYPTHADQDDHTQFRFATRETRCFNP